MKQTGWNLMGHLIKGSRRFTVMSDDVWVVSNCSSRCSSRDALLLIEFPYSFIRKMAHFCDLRNPISSALKVSRCSVESVKFTLLIYRRLPAIEIVVLWNCKFIELIIYESCYSSWAVLLYGVHNCVSLTMLKTLKMPIQSRIDIPKNTRCEFGSKRWIKETKRFLWRQRTTFVV